MLPGSTSSCIWWSLIYLSLVYDIFGVCVIVDIGFVVFFFKWKLNQMSAEPLRYLLSTLRFHFQKIIV